MSEAITSSELDCSKEELQKQLTNVTKLYRQCENKLETQNQEIYNQRREVNRLKCLEAEYIQEIEVLHSAEQNLEAKYEVKVKNLEEELSKLHREHLESIDEHKLEIEKRDSEIEELQNFVKTVQDDTNKETKLIDDLNKENNCLKDCVNKLSGRIEELTKINEDLEKQYSITDDTIIDLRKEITELLESYTCKEVDLYKANSLVLNYQEENALMKNELELLKSTPLNCKSQGNSLFAEVDEKRIELQQTFAQMKVRYKDLQKEKNIHLGQISELQLQVTTLCQRWEDEQKEKMNDEEREENSYKTRIKMLESLISSYKKDILELQGANGIDLNDDGIIEYVKTMTNKKNKEIEEQRVRIDGLSISHSLLCLHIKEANAEIRKWKAEVTRLQCKNRQLQTEIEKLKLNYENTILTKDSSSSNLPKLQNDLANDVTEEMNRKLSNIDLSRHIRKSKVNKERIEKVDKENIEETVGGEAIKKRVQFTKDTQEPKTTNQDVLRRGGKVLQVQTIHIPNIKKKLM